MKRQHILPWDLIISKLKGTLTDEEEQRFAEWIALKENRELFESVHREWIDVQTYCDRFSWDKEQCWNELLTRLDWKKSETNVTSINKKHILRLKNLAVSACAAVVLGVALFYGTRYAMNARLEHTIETYTSLNGKSQVCLPDGSLVRLHADASISRNALFGHKTREISLNGEAYFEITSDKEKPFVVHASGVSIKVYGTKFNVASLSDADVVSVSLLEGSVAMTSVTETRFLLPGETGIYNKTDRSITIKSDDVTFASSWAQDRLLFEDRPLGEIARYLSKWYHTDIYVDDDIADCTFSFTLQREPLEEILRLMSRIHPISYQFDQKNKVNIYRKRKGL